MSELEDFKAGKESRSGHAGGSLDVAQRLVDAAFYRESHQQEPPQSTEDAKSDEQA